MRALSRSSNFLLYVSALAHDYLLDEGPLNRFLHPQITAKDLIESLAANQCTLKELHIDTRVTFTPVASLWYFTKSITVRNGCRDLALTSRDRMYVIQRDELRECGRESDEEEKEDEAISVYSEN